MSCSRTGAFWRCSLPESTVGPPDSAGCLFRVSQRVVLVRYRLIHRACAHHCGRGHAAGLLLRRRRPDGRFLFLAFVGTAAFLASLPLLDFLRHLSPGRHLSQSRALVLSHHLLAGGRPGGGGGRRPRAQDARQTGICGRGGGFGFARVRFGRFFASLDYSDSTSGHYGR